VKIFHYFGCLVIGHNKVLEHWIEAGYTVFFSVCTQCNKRWQIKDLGINPKVVRKTHTIRMHAQGKQLPINIAPKIVIPKKIHKKQSVNIYLL